jgi:hypothetical protein
MKWSNNSLSPAINFNSANLRCIFFRCLPTKNRPMTYMTCTLCTKSLLILIPGCWVNGPSTATGSDIPRNTLWEKNNCSNPKWLSTMLGLNELKILQTGLRNHTQKSHSGGFIIVCKCNTFKNKQNCLRHVPLTSVKKNNTYNATCCHVWN